MPNIDSIKLLAQKVDSLNKVLNNSKQFWPLKFGEPPVQAALVVSFVTLITVVLGFIFKDYWIPRWILRRNKRLDGQYLFNNYKNNIFKSALSFNRRLEEIYRTRSHYLWLEIPNSNFYDYKYKSTVYRLCTLLGWIRAYRIQEAKIIAKKSDDIHKISSALSSLESALADGQGVEMFAAKAICKLSDVNVSTLNPDILNKFSVEIDHLVQKIHSANDIDNIYESNDTVKESFIKELIQLMSKLSINHDKIDNNKDEVSRIVSIRLGLIYRDWQAAIGDLMIEKEENTYDIIGYKRFEEIWLMDDKSEDKKWLLRVEKMFRNLDLRLDENYDSRIQQLRKVYNSIYHLLTIFYKIEVGTKPISEVDFNKIPNKI